MRGITWERAITSYWKGGGGLVKAVWRECGECGESVESVESVRVERECACVESVRGESVECAKCKV